MDEFKAVVVSIEPTLVIVRWTFANRYYDPKDSRSKKTTTKTIFYRAIVSGR